MLKKAFGMLAVEAFVFGATSNTGFVKDLVSTCTYVCCDHDGEMWDN